MLQQVVFAGRRAKTKHKVSEAMQLSARHRQDLVQRLGECFTPEHLLGCDFLLSAFLAAATCANRNSVCKPFPTRVFSFDRSGRDGTPVKDFCRAVRALGPALPSVQELHAPAALHALSDDALQALSWLLAGEIRLKSPMCYHEELEVRAPCVATRVLNWVLRIP